MKIKNFIRVLLSVVLVFGFSSAWAKTIKWSMQGDSLTLDPHAQNEVHLYLNHVEREVKRHLNQYCLMDLWLMEKD